MMARVRKLSFTCGHSAISLRPRGEVIFVGTMDGSHESPHLSLGAREDALLVDLLNERALESVRQSVAPGSICGLTFLKPLGVAGALKNRREAGAEDP